MIRSPRLGRAIVRWLLPSELAEAIEGDLEEGLRRRAAAGGRFRRLRALAWFWWQVASIPYWSLGRRARRLERREARRGDGERGGMRGTTRGGRGMGRWGTGMGSLGLDVRVAVRTLIRRPGFAVATILTLTLSIGAATLLFSVTEGVILRPLPYEEPDRVVNLYLLNHEWRESENELLRRNWDGYNPTPRHVEAFRAAGAPLVEAGFWAPTRGTIQVREHEETVMGVRVDRGVFSTLGVRPALGRLPTDREYAEGGPVAVLRHDLWAELFGGDLEVVGRSFRYRDALHTVIGVMPRGFFFPREGIGGFWSPIPPEEAGYVGFGVGRLALGTTVAEATAALDRIAGRMGDEDPGLAHLGARAAPALDDLVRDVRAGVLLLLATALVVLLVACVNLANLVLVRGAGRRGELAVRAAIGAPRASLLRAVFMEVWIVCLVGGSLGTVVAALLVDPFVAGVAASVGHLPRSGAIGLNGTVLGFTLAATLATALAAGLPAALGAARRAPAAALGEAAVRGGGHSGRLGRSVLLAVQVALAALLLSGTGLFVTSALRAGAVDPGFPVDGLAWLEISLGDDGTLSSPERAAALEGMRQRVERLPGVRSVGFASSLPIQGGLSLLPLRAADAPEEVREVASSHVTPGYFATLGVPMLEGRVPEGRTGGGEPLAAVVTESLARSLDGPGPVLGRRLVQRSGEDERALEVRAIVADSRQFILEEPLEQVYVVDPAVASWRTVALVRTSGAAALDVLPRVQTALDGTAPGVKVEDQGTLRADVSEATRHLRLRAGLVAALAGLAALLAVVGIAGIAAWFLAEQRHDIAVRLALGAEPGVEIARVMRHALVPSAAGLGAGLVAALGLSGLVAGLLFDTSHTDPTTYAAVGAFLLVVSALAAWLPGRRATEVDPARVLDRGG